jgi:hypothetical protein
MSLGGTRGKFSYIALFLLYWGLLEELEIFLEGLLRYTIGSIENKKRISKV